MTAALAALAITAVLLVVGWGILAATTPSRSDTRGRHTAPTPCPPPPASTSPAPTARPAAEDQPPAAPPAVASGMNTATGDAPVSAMVLLDELGPYEPPAQPDLMVPAALCPTTPPGWLTNTGVQRLVDFPAWDRRPAPDGMVSGGTCS